MIISQNKERKEIEQIIDRIERLLQNIDKDTKEQIIFCAWQCYRLGVRDAVEDWKEGLEKTTNT